MIATILALPRFFEIGVNETNLYTTDLRTSADYIRYYYVGTHFVMSALIPFVLLLLLNISIIYNIYITKKEVTRYSHIFWGHA